MSSLDLFGNPQESLPHSKNLGEEPSSYSSPILTVGEEIDEETAPKRSFVGLSISLTLIIALLAVQCFHLQIIEGSQNRALAEGNTVRLIDIPAERGLITDWSGKVLAQNTRQLALAIDPQTLPSTRAERNKIYALLHEKAGIPQTTLDLIEKNRQISTAQVVVKTNLTGDESLLYKEWFADTPGVLIKEAPVRQYADMTSLGQIAGYVGPVVTQAELDEGHTLDQQVGKAGLETVYDKQLSGSDGKEKAFVDAFGKIVTSLPETEISPAETGQTLRLSIDSNLQKIVADALNHALERRKATFGDLNDMGASAVIIDPSTGAIKAMVSLPDYNANLFSQGISQQDYQSLTSNPANPLLNRTIQGQYPSGSVIKPLIGAAALDAGVIGADTNVYTPASINIGPYNFPDWKFHGDTNMRKAIAESNDVYFYAMGGGWPDQHISGLGIDRMNQYLAAFGLGKKTGIDLPGEVGGLLPSPAWKEKTVGEPWYIGDTYHSSIGQGYTLVTPLQMAVSTAAIANGGTVYQPSIAWSTIDPTTGKETVLPHKVITQQVAKPEDVEVAKEGMRQTVLSGSAQPLKTLTVASAGKTGTAEFGDKGLTHAWFTGFAPYDNPRYVYAIMIEAGGESFDSSLPVAEEILRGAFNDPLAPGQKLNSEPTITPDPEFVGEH